MFNNIAASCANISSIFYIALLWLGSYSCMTCLINILHRSAITLYRVPCIVIFQFKATGKIRKSKNRLFSPKYKGWPIKTVLLYVLSIDDKIRVPPKNEKERNISHSPWANICIFSIHSSVVRWDIHYVNACFLKLSIYKVETRNIRYIYSKRIRSCNRERESRAWRGSSAHINAIYIRTVISKVIDLILTWQRTVFRCLDIVQNINCICL